MIVIKRQGKLETGEVLPALQDTLEELFEVEVGSILWSNKAHHTVGTQQWPVILIKYLAV